MDQSKTVTRTFICCCEQSDCKAELEHHRIVQELKKDLGLAARAGMQLVKQSQENEKALKTEIDQLGAENSRLLRQNAQLIAASTEHTQANIEAQSRVTQLESQLASALSRASQLSSYYSLAIALEEQVSTLEAMRADLEKERDTAIADSIAYQNSWRASQKLAAQIQTAYDTLESSIPRHKPAVIPSGLSTVPTTPRDRFPRHGMITPDPTPDVSLEADPRINESETTLASELEAFSLKGPTLRRATSHESIFGPPPLNLQPVFAPQFSARPSIVSQPAPERVVVSGVRSGPGRGAARAILGNVKR